MKTKHSFREPKEKKGKLEYKNKRGWFFLLPALILVTIFGWYPCGMAFIICFQKFYLIKPSVFIGFENFRLLLFFDWMVPLTFKNTFIYTGLSLALTFLIPIIIAILLMEMRKSVVRIMMILWFIPVASMAGIVIWKYFYDPNWGLFNAILVKLGLPKSRWLQDANLAMICLVLPGLIMFSPGLVYIASLQSIPSTLYEAAEAEGARFWQKVWYVTLPRLRPIIAVMLILSMIGNVQIFQQPFVMTGGGPNNTTMMVMLYIYRVAFKSLKYGRATALSILLFIVLISLIVLQRKYFKENIDV